MIVVAEIYENLGDRTRALELIRRALQTDSSIQADMERTPGLQILLTDPKYRRIAASHRP